MMVVPPSPYDAAEGTLGKESLTLSVLFLRLSPHILAPHANCTFC